MSVFDKCNYIVNTGIIEQDCGGIYGVYLLL